MRAQAARRGLGSKLYALGVPDKTIQMILRHANVTTTMGYYVKSAPADAVVAMVRLETALPELGNKLGNKRERSPQFRRCKLVQ